jgi:hypothetical protein
VNGIDLSGATAPTARTEVRRTPRKGWRTRRFVAAATGPGLLLIAACAGEPEPPPAARGEGGASDTAAGAPPVAEPAPADTGGTANAIVGERAIGSVRLGMSEDELRSAHSGARDTTWQIEGLDEQGVIVPFGAGDATALLVNGAVARINVRDPALKTATGLGVGATLGALRAAYGRACAATGEDGRAVVWFAAEPGVSFALDQRPRERSNAIQEDPSLLPDDAVVEELWVHGASVAC